MNSIYFKHSHLNHQPTSLYMPAQLWPKSPGAQSLPPQKPHMDPRYAQSVGCYPPARNPYARSGQNHDKKRKKRRSLHSKQITDVLGAWLHTHLDSAYPSEEQKVDLSRVTGLSEFQPSIFRYYPCSRILQHSIISG